LVKPEQRAASFALNRVAGNFGIGSGATVAGFLVASAQRLSSFQTLYFFDAATYAGFALIVLACRTEPASETVTATDANGTGFRAVRSRSPFLTVIAANIVLVVVGHTFFSNILPPFAKTHTPVGPRADRDHPSRQHVFVVIAQIPAVRVVARLRRTHAFAAASALFASACSRCCQRRSSTRSSLRPVSSPALRSSSQSANAHTFSFSGLWSRTWLQPICSAATCLSTV